MSQCEFLNRLVNKLDAAGTPLMISGPLGNTFYGEPRSTSGIDIVIEPSAVQLEQFLKLISDLRYVNPQSANESLARRSMSNLVDYLAGWKADLIIRKNRPCSRTEFTVRRRAELLGVAACVAAAEDVILSKLEWAKAGDSERPPRDAVDVLNRLGDGLDLPCLRHCAREPGVDELPEKLPAARGAPGASDDCTRSKQPVSKPPALSKAVVHAIHLAFTCIEQGKVNPADWSLAVC